MSHKIYHTEGFVIESFNLGEANRYFKIFTKDYGMVGATAQGVRHLKSKLRYSLQDLSYCNVSLVRGREVWRITSARVHPDYSSMVLENNFKRVVWSRLNALVKKLVQGEEKDVQLFKILRNGYLFLAQKDLGEREVYNLEVIVVLQILNTLGYLDAPEKYMPFVETDIFSASLVKNMSDKKNDAINYINNTLESIDL